MINKPDYVGIVPIMVVPSASDFAATFLAKVLHESIAQLVAVVFIFGYHEAQIPRAAVSHGYGRNIKFFFNRIGNFIQALMAVI